MAIPEAQLETWSHQGSIQQSSATYQAVRSALLDRRATYADQDFEVFLQGSYGNDTNTYAESDVDVVVRLDSIWRSDLTSLPPDQQDAYHRTFGKATYTFQEFKEGVLLRLSKAFGSGSIRPENKAIKIKANGSRRSTDVVACYQYRRYTRFVNEEDQDFVPGIIFPSEVSGEIVNYPHCHAANCTTKHQATNEWFKPMVRIAKNIRTRLVEQGTIAKDTAPSYYIEGLLWNVPKESFGQTYQDTFCNCFSWLLGAEREKLRCANKQYLLLGNSNVKWPPDKCDRFLEAVRQFWITAET